MPAAPVQRIADQQAAELIRGFDLARLSPAFLNDPYPTYTALREHAPIHRLPDGSFFLTRYDDVAQVYRDTATWSSDKKIDFKPAFADSLLYEHHTTSLVFNDPPVHTRVRKLLAPVFTPRALKAIEPRIEALVDRLLDHAAQSGVIDLIDDFAAAIPMQLIGDLLGVPQSERGPLRKWSLTILGALEPVLKREQFDAGVNSVAEFKDYLTKLIAERQQSPGTDGREILSILINASEFAAGSAARGGERLSELELLHNCIFLLNAGHETTTNLIGNSVDLLLRYPLRYSPVVTGLAFLPMVACIMISANVATIVLMPRFGPKPLVTTGMLIAAAGMLWLTRIGLHSSYVTAVLPALMVLGLGLGQVIAPSINTGTFGVRPSDAGVASASVNTGQQLGGSVGTALLNTVATSAAAGDVASHASPATVIHGRPSAGLLGLALVHGYTTAFWWSAVIFACGAVVAGVLLRRGPLTQRDPGAGPAGIPEAAHEALAPPM